MTLTHTVTDRDPLPRNSVVVGCNGKDHIPVQQPVKWRAQ